jgi:hypothetical protein
VPSVHGGEVTGDELGDDGELIDELSPPVHRSKSCSVFSHAPGTATNSATTATTNVRTPSTHIREELSDDPATPTPHLVIFPAAQLQSDHREIVNRASQRSAAEAACSRSAGLSRNRSRLSSRFLEEVVLRMSPTASGTDT